MKHKYKVAPAQARTMDGITFDSKAEMQRYAELKLLRQSGRVIQFIPQTPSFRLPGGVKYTADFGPMKARWNRFFGRFWLRRWVDVIVCRNDTSYRDFLSRVHPIYEPGRYTLRRAAGLRPRYRDLDRALP